MCPGRTGCTGAWGARSSRVGPAGAGQDQWPTPGGGHKGVNPSWREPRFSSAAVHQGRQELCACPEAGTSLGSRAPQAGPSPQGGYTPAREGTLGPRLQLRPPLTRPQGLHPVHPHTHTHTHRSRRSRGQLARGPSLSWEHSRHGLASPGASKGHFCLESTAAHPSGSCPGGCKL